MSTTIGQKLRRKREELHLTIEEAARATRIRPHYIQTMEAGEFQAIPSTVQARGFLRAYADYLNLNSELLLAELEGKTVPVPTIDEAGEPRPPRSAAGDGEANRIFQEVGRDLCHQRELLGLSLEDVERHTHLRQHYLVALEAGNLEGLPSPVQGRGMLNNYAAFLGLNPEPLLLRFADGLQARLAAHQSTLLEKKRSAGAKRKSRLPGPLRRSLTGDLLIGATLAVFLVIFVSWLAVRVFSMTSRQVSEPTAPSIAEVLLATATPTITPTALPVTPTAPPVAQPFPTQAIVTDAETGATLAVTPSAGVQVYLTVRQRAWLRVLVDSVPEFEGRVIPGSAYTFSGQDSVQVDTSNAAGIQIFFNGIDQGRLGDFGQVASRMFGPQGQITPTPTVTLTPTNTAPVPPTQIPGSTPAPGTAPALP